MLDALEAALKIASSGLAAQSARLRVVTENVANAESTASIPGGDPYRRKTVTFASEIDRASGVSLVQLKRIGEDDRPFRTEYHPGHPAADAEGVVKLPNIDLVVELADMKEANRSYEAALQIFRQTRELHAMTLDLLKA
jgi:flagellar basal-body rod protein FlgC